MTSTIERRYVLISNIFNCLVSTKGEDEETKFEVHKTILMARSEVFAAMLSNTDMSETRTNSTTIKDLSPGALKEMLRFLYTDQVFISIL